jgi:hypothetical protein
MAHLWHTGTKSGFGWQLIALNNRHPLGMFRENPRR